MTASSAPIALARAKRQDFPVPVNAFIADSVDLQRDQFLRINNTKPLPRGLVTELLPKISTSLPPRLSMRKAPSALCDLLNTHEDSPFRGLIRRPSTSAEDRATAVVTDTSIVQALEESLKSPSGALFPYRNLSSGETDFAGIWAVLLLYWTAVRDTFPQAWGKPPEKSRLMHGAGIRAMGRFMDRIMASVDARAGRCSRSGAVRSCAAGPVLSLDRRPVGRAGHAVERDPERPPAYPRTVQLPHPRLSATPRRSDEVLLPRQPGPDRPYLRLHHRGTLTPAGPAARRPLHP